MPDNMWVVSDLVDALEPDPWRDSNPFSTDIEECHRVLFDPQRTIEAKAKALDHWLANFQPCLFGQMEAKQGRIAYCVLTENHFERGDDAIRAEIERCRRIWKELAANGQRHAFVIVAVAERIARARQTATLLRLAIRLCELYLGCTETDQIHLDDLMLEIDLGDKTERRSWRVGVNFFSSQGDGRWWRDHRFPGGMAFSMNSVGHMARTRAEEAIRRNPDLLQQVPDVPRERLVHWALPKAMKTIGPPYAGSTRGTWLVERGTFPEDKEPPDFDEREKYFGELANFSENRYRGLYHTDQTIPTVCFNEGLWRREDIPERDDLVFTYLHQRTEQDYLSMGLGELPHEETTEA
jgi:hypothetical protein